MRLVISRNDNARLSFAFSLMLLLIYIINAAEIIETRVGISQSMVSMFCKLTMVVLIFFNIGCLFRNLNRKIFILCLILLCIFLINKLLFINNDYFNKTIIEFAVNVFPVFLIISCISDYDKLLDYLVTISRIIITLSIFIVMIVDRGNTSYNMGYSASLQIPVLILMYNYYRYRKLLDIFFIAVSVTEIVLFGSRGPLLGIGVFLLLLIFLNEKTSIWSVVGAFFILICLTCYKIIIEKTYLFFEKLGFSSRTLWLLINDVSHDSGRSNAYNSMINEIRLNPFWPHGIAGEYAITGGYAHNMILELLIDFGVIVGGVLCIVLVYYLIGTIKDFIKIRDSKSIVTMVMLTSSVPLAMVSGSIWISAYLWCWIVLAIKKYDG